MTKKRVPLLLLDLDGTVRQGKDDALGKFVNGPEDVIVFPEAVERMRWWRNAGGRIVGVSNQGGIALGIVSVEKVDQAMAETHRQADDLFDLIMWCEHHPDASDLDERNCWCRKPKPGMVIRADGLLREEFGDETYPISEMLFVGDRLEDMQCAEWLGVRFMDAFEWRSTTTLTVEDPK